MDLSEQIVVAEDDQTIRTLLELALLGAGYRRVVTCSRGDEALAEVRRLVPDLVLLDVMLPGADGYAVARAVRSDPALAAVRIIMITARTQPEDIVCGLEAGADDYIAKPFDRAVLLARIRAVLRRGLPALEGRDFDGLVVDAATRIATLDGRELELSPGEFALLARLVAHRGRILPRPPDDRTLDVRVAALRRKLGVWASHLETVRGVGYRVRL